MDQPAYENELKLLGLHGPQVEGKVDGAYWVGYRMDDGTYKRLPPPDVMSPAERADTVAALKEHLGIIERNRRAGAKDDCH